MVKKNYFLSKKEEVGHVWMEAEEEERGGS